MALPCWRNSSAKQPVRNAVRRHTLRRVRAAITSHGRRETVGWQTAAAGRPGAAGRLGSARLGSAAERIRRSRSWSAAIIELVRRILRRRRRLRRMSTTFIDMRRRREREHSRDADCTDGLHCTLLLPLLLLQPNVRRIQPNYKRLHPRSRREHFASSVTHLQFPVQVCPSTTLPEPVFPISL